MTEYGERAREGGGYASQEVGVAARASRRLKLSAMAQCRPIRITPRRCLQAARHPRTSAVTSPTSHTHFCRVGAGTPLEHARDSGSGIGTLREPAEGTLQASRRPAAMKIQDPMRDYPSGQAGARGVTPLEWARHRAVVYRVTTRTAEGSFQASRRPLLVAPRPANGTGDRRERAVLVPPNRSLHPTRSARG